MLLAMLLPLQGYAAMSACQDQVRADIGAAATATATATQHDCTHATAPTHQHNCGQCCCGVGIALTPSLFITPPYFAAAETPPTAIAAPPQGALDRLDRPPRFILA